MQMIGLEAVKATFVGQYDLVCLAQERGESLAASYNALFDGNPGTGKTTVARLYGQFLKEVGILPQTSMFKETSGSKLIFEGVKGLEAMLKELKKAGGGVIFVDEATQLDPAREAQGRQVLNFLLTHAESLKSKDYGSLVWVFAGYKKEMDTLFTYNTGLPSRFPVQLTFADYSEAELLAIFEETLLRRGGAQPLPPGPSFTVCDDKWSRIMIRRLAASIGRRGFANARAVRILFDKAKDRQARRITAARGRGEDPDIFVLERDDLLGPRASMEAIALSEAYIKLTAMEGLKEVKDSVEKLLTLVALNAVCEEEETPMLPVALNRVFLGNPGTGKTTVAALYAAILADIGLLSKGEVILKNPSDFIGQYIGQSEEITRGILQQAEGCVLVIDEAYVLNPALEGKSSTGGYKASVINTIVEQVQGVPGEDRVVVLLGYKKEMTALMDANPGLSRRFQFDFKDGFDFIFSDYGDEILVRMLCALAEKQGLEIDADTAVFAVSTLNRNVPHFGNAGAVNNLLSMANLNFARRGSGALLKELLKEDFGLLPAACNVEEIFADLVGCKQILKKLGEYPNAITAAKSLDNDPKDVLGFNFLFVGGPGTGKSTVARKFGKLFYSLGLLPTDEVVEITAKNLTPTAEKTVEFAMREARGKVLFIKDAHQLSPEVGGDMVKVLKSQQLKGQIVIILAGYDADIHLRRVNEGLMSHFTEKLLFKNFNAETTADMLAASLRKVFKASMSPSVPEAMRSIAERLVAAPDFANGWDVYALGIRVFTKFNSRIGGRQGMDLELVDLEQALQSVLAYKPENKVKVEVIDFTEDIEDEDNVEMGGNKD